MRELKGKKGAWKQFLANALHLKEKLGPILFQFPPSFKATVENVKRIESFLKFIAIPKANGNKFTPVKKLPLRFAMEFRQKSWCDPEGKLSASYGVNKKIYNLLKKYNVAWVIADSPSCPILRHGSGQEAEIVTADFVYIRMHGSKILFASKYTKKELSSLAKKNKKMAKPEFRCLCLL